MGLKEYAGAAPATRLSGSLASGTLTNFAVITGGGAGYPTGSTAPFVVVIDRGTATEEKILVTARSGDTFSGLTRGYDGAGSGQAHAAQAVVEHVYDAVSASEASQHTNVTTRDDHTQYMKADGTRHDLTARHGATAVDHGSIGGLADDDHSLYLPSIEIPHTWVIGADVRVASGDTDFLPGFFVPAEAGRVVTLTRCRYKINSGTSATVKMQKNGADITGFTGITVSTTAATTNPADVALADMDLLTLVVTAVSGTPRNLNFSAILRYSRL